MKWLLISMMLNNPMVYADEATCNKAVKAIAKMDPDAVCIPAGVDKGEENAQMIRKFLKAFSASIKK
ncbi:MAG: hypothetical protein VW270_19435 [Candidatus Poseidoniales archaeon]